jgi:hypothetical protein
MERQMQYNGSMIMTGFTAFLYVLSVITLQQVAALATIFAGFTAGAFTIYKWVIAHKKHKKDVGETE